MTKESDKIGNLKYSTWYINIISMFISISLLFILEQIYSHINFSLQRAVLKAGFSVNIETQTKNNQVEFKSETITKEKCWYLEIPIINLKADIEEGTTKEILDKYVGHFEESKKWIGNVCLAAHNRGYEKNYFAEIKKLKKGDKIDYYYNKDKKQYTVEENKIIKATDLSCLENTEENTLTLITCVENEPNYRRCIKAIERLEK